ncbi:DUF488 domain-containing protein [Rhizobium sophoriradicis]|uniref:DUF488 domain-containing protein n=1 Tax=Rhizobium sophoriradicis TaxID=1535245 RepID=UPI00098EA2EE|nr:DUF488 domain-containing protein [Rhizobium sophoriradicis]RSB86887.1 DUF488 domain-containing protein [Rhizobium sophoriradicis]
MADTAGEVLTIGHSTLPYERFLELLRQASVTAIADVRTAPYSRHFPQFNRETLRDELRLDQIAYVFLGEELGGRPKDKRFFCDGVADYEKMAMTKDFARGLDRVVEGSKKYRIALMCSEHDPLDCHRCLLVGRALHERGIAVRHILGNGATVDQVAVEARLMKMSGKNNSDLFDPPAERLAAAYRDRAMKVAFAERQTDFQPKSAVGE